MSFNPEKHHRRSIRLHGYDYSQGGIYFVTICTPDRALLFADPVICSIAEQCWHELPNHFAVVELDEWVVMPNHLHGIPLINPDRQGRDGVQLNAPTRAVEPSTQEVTKRIAPHRDTLSVIIRTYKAAVTTLCRRQRYVDFAWQRNYYEHIVRDQAELDRIRQYIHDNPKGWGTDENHPNRVGAFE
ncbi:MAG: hypothetical protein AVDCRST_MAG88-3830 [uncultured Thermomicrobiales bacterium]|uniref:Transposase IS200-like domain-containing protein n=1 Tax=uncultured Thermomicrobiales bacterium TaxID=1645740 RepID=A0A6J4VWS2_9BACT|nr:MAG: hypothetical protein AVDCRST_MAG88-3830 [uncultured Thermomicrobiales bacterium]